MFRTLEVRDHATFGSWVIQQFGCVAKPVLWALITLSVPRFLSSALGLGLGDVAEILW